MVDRFILITGETLEALTEALNDEMKKDVSYYTIRDIREYGHGYAALIDRMPVELVTLNSYVNDNAYERAEMA